MILTGTVPAIADAAAFQTWFEGQLDQANIDYINVTGAPDPLTISLVDPDLGRLHVGVGFQDNGSLIDIAYRGFVYFNTNLPAPVDADRKNPSTSTGSLSFQTWSFDTTDTYTYTITTDQQSYFSMFLTPAVGDQKFFYFCHADPHPLFNQASVDTALSSGAGTIDVPAADQSNSWNPQGIYSGTNLTRRLMVVENGGDGNYEEVEVSSVSGDTLTLNGTLANDYSSFRIGNAPIRTFIHASATDSGLFTGGLESVWSAPSGWRTTTTNFASVIRHTDMGDSAPDTLLGLHAIGKIAMLLDNGDKTVPEFSLPGLGVVTTGANKPNTGDTVYDLNADRTVFDRRWQVVGKDVTNSTQVTVLE